MLPITIEGLITYLVRMMPHTHTVCIVCSGQSSQSFICAAVLAVTGCLRGAQQLTCSSFAKRCTSSFCFREGSCSEAFKTAAKWALVARTGCIGEGDGPLCGAGEGPLEIWRAGSNSIIPYTVQDQHPSHHRTRCIIAYLERMIYPRNKR